MFKPDTNARPPRIKVINIDNWNRGRVSILDENRQKMNGLDESINVDVRQDGTIGSRDGLVLYGKQLDHIGKIVGLGNFSVIDNGQATRYLIAAVNPTGTDYSEIYVNKDSQDWQKIDDSKYNTTDKHYFLNVDQKVLITNGVDKISYLDVATSPFKIVRFIRIDEPTGLSLSQQGLSSGDVTIRYAVVGQNQGETLPSYFPVQKVDRERITWSNDSGTNEKTITLTWNKMPNTKNYLIYVGNKEGEEQFLTRVVDDGDQTTTTMSWTDNGMIFPNAAMIVPKVNNSDGVVAKKAVSINGQVYLIGNKDNPYRIYYGGREANNLLDFSAFSGGYIDINPGSETTPNTIEDFRDRTGRSVATVMTDASSENAGNMQHLSQITQSVGGVPIDIMTVESSGNQYGTIAPDAVVNYGNSLWFLGYEGFLTTGTKPQYQNVLSTDVISQTIDSDVRNLNVKAAAKTVATIYKGKMLWSLPIASENNSETWVLDIARGGIWLLPWTIAADLYQSYTDNSGVKHKLALVDNKLMEFKDGSFSVDGGTPFKTKIKTSKVRFSDDGLQWARVLLIRFELIDPRGDFTFTVRGKTKRGTFSRIENRSYYNPTGRLGWGRIGRFVNKFSSVIGFKKANTSRTKTVIFKVNKNLNNLICEIETNSAVRYQLSRITAEIIPNIGILERKERR